jgi:hypothetical protein
MNRERDQENAELDSFDVVLQEQFQRQGLSAVEDADTIAIWQAMLAELHCETNNTLRAEKAKGVPRAEYFTYRNMLTLAAVGLFLAFSSMFLVAAQQRRDGTVLSKTTDVNRFSRRDRKNDGKNQEWLPEEREILRQLMRQPANGTGPDSSVAVELALSQK